MSTPQKDSVTQANAYKNFTQAEMKAYYTHLLAGGTAEQFFNKAVAPDLAKYSPDQERDDHGRFGSGSGEPKPEAREPQTMPYPMRIGSNENWLSEQNAEVVGTAFKNVALDPIRIRMTSESVAKLAEDGRLKSVFETGKNFADNPGSTYLNNRNNLETNIWKVPEGAARPIYAYMDSNYDNHIPSVSIYGNAEATLKDEVANRTTMTAGDSLNNYLVPVQVMDAREGNLSAQALSNATERDSVRAGHVYTGYYEAQIHGGVSISDIKSVDFFGKSIDRSVYDSLKSQGVEVKNARRK